MPASDDDEPERSTTFQLEPRHVGVRIDKAALDAADPSLGLSRSRIQSAIAGGRLALDGRRVLDASSKVKAPGTLTLETPAPAPAEPEPEDLPLEVLFEDASLLVVVKEAGVASHPAPGSETGTLVNALLHHVGPGLFDVGGVERPGLVHRLDKDTSGVLVVAKTDRALAGLSSQFAAHSVERRYRALAWGAPERGDPRLHGLPAVTFEPGAIRIDAAIGRHPADRKRMAVRPESAAGARRAVTRAQLDRRFGPAERPVASRVSCRLETGRTHQIRVHLAHIGHPLIGDPVYGRRRRLPDGLGAPEARAAIDAFARQALHAESLGFEHPISGERLAFDAPPPDDFTALENALASLIP